MFLSALDAILLGNMLADKEKRENSQKQGVIRAGEGTIKAEQEFSCYHIL